MNRPALRITAALVLWMVLAVLYAAGAGGEGGVMKDLSFAGKVPALDLAVPARLETATFALG